MGRKAYSSEDDIVRSVQKSQRRRMELLAKHLNRKHQTNRFKVVTYAR